MRRKLVLIIAALLVIFGVASCGPLNGRYNLNPEIFSAQWAPVRNAILWGDVGKPNTIIWYTNLQCPYARQMWPEIQKVMKSAPQTKLVLKGSGFDQAGELIIFIITLMAEQDQVMARAFITDVIKGGKAPFSDPYNWSLNWGKRKYKNKFNPERFTRLYNDNTARQAYNLGQTETVAAYNFSATPATAVNGKFIRGLTKSAVILNALKTTAPRPEIP